MNAKGTKFHFLLVLVILAIALMAAAPAPKAQAAFQQPQAVTTTTPTATVPAQSTVTTTTVAPAPVPAPIVNCDAVIAFLQSIKIAWNLNIVIDQSICAASSASGSNNTTGQTNPQATTTPAPANTGSTTNQQQPTGQQPQQGQNQPTGCTAYKVDFPDNGNSPQYTIDAGSPREREVVNIWQPGIKEVTYIFPKMKVIRGMFVGYGNMWKFPDSCSFENLVERAMTYAKDTGPSNHSGYVYVVKDDGSKTLITQDAFTFDPNSIADPTTITSPSAAQAQNNQTLGAICSAYKIDFTHGEGIPPYSIDVGSNAEREIINVWNDGGKEITYVVPKMAMKRGLLVGYGNMWKFPDSCSFENLVERAMTYAKDTGPSNHSGYVYVVKDDGSKTLITQDAFTFDPNSIADPTK